MRRFARGNQSGSNLTALIERLASFSHRPRQQPIRNT
jgi:hypothetical protein